MVLGFVFPLENIEDFYHIKFFLMDLNMQSNVSLKDFQVALVCKNSIVTTEARSLENRFSFALHCIEKDFKDRNEAWDIGYSLVKTDWTMFCLPCMRLLSEKSLYLLQGEIQRHSPLLVFSDFYVHKKEMGKGKLIIEKKHMNFSFPYGKLYSKTLLDKFKIEWKGKGFYSGLANNHFLLRNITLDQLSYVPPFCIMEYREIPELNDDNFLADTFEERISSYREMIKGSLASHSRQANEMTALALYQSYFIFSKSKTLLETQKRLIERFYKEYGYLYLSLGENEKNRQFLFAQQDELAFQDSSFTIEGFDRFMTDLKIGYSPSSKNVCPSVSFEGKNNYYICAMIKDEHPYIREWVNYHLDLGFDKIFLFDDRSSHGYEKELGDLIDCGKVFVGRADQEGGARQINTYNSFLHSRQWGENDYCAFIDVDEFLYFDNAHDVNEFMREYKDYAGVGLCWKSYNANGRVKAPQGISTISAYPKEFDCPDKRAKYIVRMADIENFINVHYAIPKRRVLVYTNKEVVKGIELPGLIYDNGYVKHYITKSWEDWVRRLKRGNVSRGLRKVETFFEYNPDLNKYKEELTKDLDLGQFPTLN